MKRLFAVAGALVLAAVLSGCAGTPKVGDPASQAVADPAADFLGELGQFTLNDLNVAMDLTGDIDHDGKVDPGFEPGDQIADQCYFFLAGKLASVGNGNSVTVAGIVSGFQSARNLKRRVGGGLSDEFMIGCGPLITDVRGDALKLIGKVAGGGILPF